ncbi:DUF4832 domain-containing protein [uncultured Aquimarina sp.]|uniref:DUF4832 domain-containing protein n=1 Tax=uncultured Aquimarina sp. TaxID=575652 RepID=UPI00262A6DE9|nr:DUF4832 domain-containing protein [uncultured Aquimarina sp.]
MSAIHNAIRVLAFLFCNAILVAQTVNYTSSQNIIANPERGLQKYSITSNNYATTVGANNLSVSTLESWKNGTDKVTVVFRYFLLDAFLDSNINNTYLDNIRNDFDNIRLAGLKTIVRFSYSNSQGTEPQQPTKVQILTHITQIAQILDENKDIILSHQAGFIGTWGEWYYTNSDEFGTEGAISAAQWNNRKEIVDAMLSATPSNIPLQVRYANIKKTMYGNTLLTEQTAYENTANARIGFFNDAFLNDYGDQGTYSVSNQCATPVGTSDYNFIANETKYLPMTGETNGLNGCDSGFRTSGTNAIDEMNLTNWTTINRDFYTPFWDGVIASNTYEEIVRRLGYRYTLLSSTVTVNNLDFDLALEIQNVGFARIFKERDVYLMIQNTETNDIITSLIDTDIRTWENTTTINQNFDIGISGTYKLYLWIPDNDTSLQTNPDYSVQLANVGTWDSQTGYNDLLQTVTLEPSLSVDDIELENNRLSIYPNPASSDVTIKVHESIKEDIQIYNSLGQLIMKIHPLKIQKIDVSHLDSGIYFFKIGNSKVAQCKLIKK